MESLNTRNKVKKVIDFLLALLALARWLPLPSQWRSIILALSAVLGTVSGMVMKCDQQSEPAPAKTSQPTPPPTAIHTTTPTPPPVTPTPRVPRIYIDRAVASEWPFTVRYSAPFEYNTQLWADQWRLGTFGRDPENGEHILYAVVLRSLGKRRLIVKNQNGVVLAEHFVEVKDAGTRK